MDRYFRLGRHIPPETDNAVALQLDLFPPEEDALLVLNPHHCAIGTLVSQGEFSAVVLDAGVGSGNMVVVDNDIVVRFSSQGGAGTIFIQNDGLSLMRQFQSAFGGRNFR